MSVELRPERRCGRYHRDRYRPWRSCWSEQWCCSSSPIHYSSHRIYAVWHPSSSSFQTNKNPNLTQPHFLFLSLNTIYLSGSLSLCSLKTKNDSIQESPTTTIVVLSVSLCLCGIWIEARFVLGILENPFNFFSSKIFSLHLE